MKKQEVEIMVKLLPELLELGESTTICHVYGIYTLKLNLTEIHVMLMKNSLLLTDPRNIMSHIFDLKGSKVKRKVIPNNLKRKHLEEFCRTNILKCEDLVYLFKFIDPSLVNLSLESRY